MILQPALMFQDGMVLQRDREIPVWGNVVPCESVTLTLQGKTYEARADAEGKWRMLCGPFHLSFSEKMVLSSGEETITFSDVMVGDVYLAGGQSNMEFHMRYDANMTEEAAAGGNPMIRLFDYPRVSYAEQIPDRKRKSIASVCERGRWTCAQRNLRKRPPFV